MKKSIFNFTIILFATGTVLTSCNSSSEKVDEAKVTVEAATQNLDQAKEDYSTQYNKFKLESDQKISANEKRIAELKESAKSMKKTMKAEYETTITDLEKRNESMKEKVKGYKEEGNEKWESFKVEFNHDMDELGKALNDLTKNNVK